MFNFAFVCETHIYNYVQWIIIAPDDGNFVVVVTIHYNLYCFKVVCFIRLRLYECYILLFSSALN